MTQSWDWGDPHFRAGGSDPWAEHGQRREIEAAHTRWANSDHARQILMPYRGQKYAAIQSGFDFKPGYIYTQVRAISARVNQNYDGWPSGELKKSFRTFIGKPVFVNHQNFDPSKARGKVVAARYIENGRDKYIETVMEIDAQRFPKLAHEIRTGGLDSVSMGVEAGFTICSYCGNRAVDVPDFCAHVKYHKGETLPRINAKTGAKEDVLVYEKCYKLGFFELSYVFDPADETAVVSRVIAAQRHEAEAAQQAPTDEIVEGQMPYGQMPTARRHAADADTILDEIRELLDNADGEDYGGDDVDDNYDLNYGKPEAPEDIDTLRGEDEDANDTDEFKHYVESPKELRGPDVDQTKRLDRDQEQEGLDRDRRVEDVEDVGGAPMPRNARRRQAWGDAVMPNPQSKPRTHDSGPSAWDADDYGEMAPSTGHGVSPSYPHQKTPKPAQGYDSPGAYHGSRQEASVLVDPRTGRRYYAADSDSDSDLISEAEDDLEKADKASKDDYSDDPGSDAGGSDDDYSDDDDSDDDSDSDDDDDSDDDSDSDSKSDSKSSSGSKPPWLDKKESRRNGNRARSTRNKRRATRGGTVSLTDRNRTASAGRRRHYADESGHTDGGPYHTDDNDQGVQEGVFLSDTPPAKSFSPPGPGDKPISNTENNLVASLTRRIQERNAQQRRDLIAYEQITGKRVTADSDDNWPSPGAQSVKGETADTVNPPLSGTNDQGIRGDDFDSVALDAPTTQPKDASIRYFRAFDQWLQNATGRTANQHNATFLRRQAARYCSASGLPVEALFPALGNVLREARKAEGGQNMRRQAVDLPAAAPQDRTDVVSPVSGTTDADAQASQFDLKDFGGNAGDNLAKPDLSPDSQIWPPGEGDKTFKNSNRKADGITAVRYAEAFIAAGLADDTPEEKWKVAGLAQTMRHGTIVDRTRLLDAVNAVHQQRLAAVRRTAGNRGAARGLPTGLGQRQLTAGTAHYSATNDIATDSAMFFKG